MTEGRDDSVFVGELIGNCDKLLVDVGEVLVEGLELGVFVVVVMVRW